MSGTDEEPNEVSIYNSIDPYRTHDTPPTAPVSPKTTTNQVVILYVIGIFLAVVLLIAMGYIFKLHYKSWLPKRKHLCDFRDCFKQSKGSGKKRKFFNRKANQTKFTIPVVVVSDENGRCLDPECIDSEEIETKFSHKFP